MTMPAQTYSPDPLTRLQAALGWKEGYDWVPLGGGRSNKIWKVTGPDGRAYVAKLYSADRGNALFPNDRDQEALALNALAGTGIAPTLLHALGSGDDKAIVYEYVDGPVGPARLEDAARVLARLHGLPPPAGLRSVGMGSKNLRALGAEFARSLMTRDVPAAPAALVEGPPVPAFLHGDPVPANMVQVGSDVALIDWQCPAIGDACEDIAVFLSPAMQSLYGGRMLDKKDRDRFLDAYGNPGVVSRFRELAPLFHWRMGVYCLWMAERGAPDYGDAARLEFQALEQVEK